MNHLVDSVGSQEIELQYAVPDLSFHSNNNSSRETEMEDLNLKFPLYSNNSAQILV